MNKEEIRNRGQSKLLTVRYQENIQWKHPRTVSDSGLKDNDDRLIKIESGDEPVIEELTRQLQEIHPDLTFEMSTNSIAEGKREFIISANGIKQAFPAVSQLVAAAPPLDAWEVTAFRQPKDINYAIHLGNYHVSPEDIWFSCEPDGDKIGLTLYVRNLLPDNEEQAGLTLFIPLDNALGEYLVETKVGYIERVPLPPHSAMDHLRPFSAIRKAID